MRHRALLSPKCSGWRLAFRLTRHGAALAPCNATLRHTALVVSFIRVSAPCLCRHVSLTEINAPLSDHPMNAGVDVCSVDEQMGRDAGALLARAHSDDPIDATVVLVARSGDRILTIDPADIDRLASCSGKRLVIVPC